MGTVQTEQEESLYLRTLVSLDFIERKSDNYSNEDLVKDPSVHANL